ncbi:hypothetical protein [Ottowia sp.]|uniref:hypothetical protein n=1 Tax=Ottowia sp. TaxID=1898956 RepID=UPI002B5BF1D5|nr:hypothetical protein [Ottowia sp.]HOB65730.1 hypothetical protein [Ottowia sp.]HPZ58523.1 hypothetical protein [Ottowia sp.]HQD47343.1 hypothetical protein [Ottowia sp.]
MPRLPDALVVTYPVGRTGALAAGLLGLGGAGWLAAIGMLVMPSAQSAKAWTAIVLIVFCGIASAALALFWRRQARRTLRWDGQFWWLGLPPGAREQGGEGARVQVRLDAQRWMLLWFGATGARRGHWLWAEARIDPARWHLLRCALYLPQSSADSARLRNADAERA